MDRIAMAKMC